MRSPLEMFEGKFDHALLTTYSFNLRFFDEWVLPALWACEVRNVVVFVDPHQLGRALADPGSSAAGRSYHLVAAHAARRSFHSKVILLSGRDGARLSVSSANLTTDGQLRNVEVAAAFDSNLPGHLRPIHDAAEMFRSLARHAPEHAAFALHAALAALPPADETEKPAARVVHNLDQTLIEAFPAEGDVVVTAPYTDPGGNAARRLHALGSLRIIIDAREFAAPQSFFHDQWTVEPQAFEARLHGKAYWVRTNEQRWLMFGSPNLSRSALLATAADGNVEAAVIVQDESVTLPPPPGTPWTDAGDIAVEADDRYRAAQRETDEGAPGAFNAWEDEGLIRVEGLTDGTAVDWWTGETWTSLGVVASGALEISTLDSRPARLRAQLADGRIALAIVAQPARLKARLRARTGGRQADAASRLPLDIETVRVLEATLAELYALSELVAEARSPAPRVDPDPEADHGETRLTEWMPRHPEEEPRISSLYMSAWRSDPDALLALITRALRLDPQLANFEDHVASEHIDIEELDTFSGDESAAPVPEPTASATNRAALEKYRRAFDRLLDRGTEFVAKDSNPTLAAAAFQYLQRLVEELGTRTVNVDGQPTTLGDRSTLRHHSFQLLNGYLGRGDPDPICLPTARHHLALCLRDRDRLTSLQRERLERLAYQWAAELLQHESEPTPTEQETRIGLTDVNAWLAPFAQRTRWDDIARHAEELLDRARLTTDPYPILIGSAAFENRLSSPAWKLIAFAAPAGQATPAPFAAIVHNTHEDSHAVVHALVCAPKESLLHEAVLRRSDSHWIVHSFRCRDRVTLEIAGRTGPVDLERDSAARDLQDLDEAPAAVRKLAELIDRELAAS